ncbi:MAG: MarR family transcriptional regulator [Candidatus Hermodarchaeota archaeon]
MELEQSFKNRLSSIEKFLKVFKIESCLLIYFYLMINGKTTPNHLRAELRISKATVFRSLGFLLDTGLVRKEELDYVPDKRSNIFYFVEKPIRDILSNFNYSSEFEAFVEAQGATKVLNEWKSVGQNSTSIFSNAVAKIFELCQEKEKPIQIIAKASVCENCGKVHVPEEQDEKWQKRRIQVFTITESPEDDIFHRLQEFLVSLQITSSSTIKKGEKMKKPLSLAIDIIEF